MFRRKRARGAAARGDRGGHRAHRIAADPIVLEPLEERLLLSADCPTIDLVEADNRGLIMLHASRELATATVTTTNVQVFRAGQDGLLGTEDDELVNRTVSLENDDTIVVDADVEANERYRVVVLDAVRDRDGNFLDGEFNGADTASGDGEAGGSYEFFARSSIAPIARMITTGGTIYLRLFVDETPLTAQNFMDYADAGAWDGTFFHRSAEDFVIQGGGFRDSDFGAIPQNDPVRNEPGISNLRGTIAVAKLGNQPDSGTNQWFFNLGDNSGNLDSQNGGFTVFGEVLGPDDLAVIDDIASLAIVDASGQGSAFGEVPVLDTDVYRANGNMITSGNLASISRVSILMDISGEPAGQLAEDQAFIVQSNRDARVLFFDLSGNAPRDMSELVRVNFSGNRIEQITIDGELGDGQIGIYIQDATGVGTIRDTRDGEATDVAFIVADTSISRVDLRGGLSGFNLNGFTLPGGLTFEEDIDGDGTAGDDLALWAAEDDVRQLRLRDRLRGDVVLPGGVRDVKIDGDVRDVDFLIGAENDPNVSVSFTMTDVRNSSIVSELPIKKIKVQQWERGNGIEAPSIDSIRAKADRDSSGEFSVSLNVFGDEDTRFGLRSFNIDGDLLNADWTITGDVGMLKVGGGLTNTYIDVDGDLAGLKADQVFVSNVAGTGDGGTIKVTEWDGGEIRFASANSIKSTGDNRRGIDGDVSALIEIRNATTERAISSIVIAGDFIGGETDIVGGINRFEVKGRTIDTEMSFRGEVGSAVFGEVDDSNFGGQFVDSLRAVRWTGGTLLGADIERIDITGDQRNGVDGDLIAELSLSGRLRTLDVAGSYSGLIDLNEPSGSIRVGGDMFQSLLIVSRTEVGDAVALDLLQVDGDFVDSELRTPATIQRMSFGRMVDASLFVGLPLEANGLPESGDGIFTGATINRLDIRGVDDGMAFIRSNISADIVNDVRLGMVDFDGIGPFGVAGNTINTVELRTDDGRTIVRSPETSLRFEDLEIRVNFVPAA